MPSTSSNQHVDLAVDRPILRSNNPPRTSEDLRAMKRALLKAPLGPKAALALASAAIELDERLRREALRTG